MRTFLRIMFIVVVAALIIGTGIAIFNAGMAQGAAMSGEVPIAAPATVYPMFPPWGFWGFGCFAIFGLFLLFPLLFGFGRMLFGPRHGRHHGPWGWHGDQVPPHVEDLHRRMHDKMNQPQP
jgi:hypothetical protein